MADAKEQNLDGKTPVKATPFDAHEQATRGEHQDATEDQHPGQGQQYPKAVDHVDGSEPGHKEPVLVNSAKEEKEYLQSKQADAAPAKPE
jgi:hypothetical protein